MDFSFEQTRFDDWIVLSQLGSLLCSHPENGDSPQLALIAERKRPGNGQVCLICHSFDESVMLLITSMNSGAFGFQCRRASSEQPRTARIREARQDREWRWVR